MLFPACYVSPARGVAQAWGGGKISGTQKSAQLRNGGWMGEGPGRQAVAKVQGILCVPARGMRWF